MTETEKYEQLSTSLQKRITKIYTDYYSLQYYFNAQKDINLLINKHHKKIKRIATDLKKATNRIKIDRRDMKIEIIKGTVDAIIEDLTSSTAHLDNILKKIPLRTANHNQFMPNFKKSRTLKQAIENINLHRAKKNAIENETLNRLKNLLGGPTEIYHLFNAHPQYMFSSLKEHFDQNESKENTTDIIKDRIRRHIKTVKSPNSKKRLNIKNKSKF